MLIFPNNLYSGFNKNIEIRIYKSFNQYKSINIEINPYKLYKRKKSLENY